VYYPFQKQSDSLRIFLTEQQLLPTDMFLSIGFARTHGDCNDALPINVKKNCNVKLATKFNVIVYLQYRAHS
jgi:hypothetical protein